jgi:hypothetical protein
VADPGVWIDEEKGLFNFAICQHLCQSLGPPRDDKYVDGMVKALAFKPRPKPFQDSVSLRIVKGERLPVSVGIRR